MVVSYAVSAAAPRWYEYHSLLHPIDELPEFPWPPPKAAAQATIPTRLLIESSRVTQMKDAAKHLFKSPSLILGRTHLQQSRILEGLEKFARQG